MTQSVDFTLSAKKVFATEIQAVEKLNESLDASFNQACQLLLNCTGKIVVIGIGKSGHIGRKIAATLASTGSPAFFVHPAEACHGDLGMISEQDIILTLSNSGESTEILTIVPVIKRIGAKLISITSNPESNIAQYSDIHIKVAVDKEACPLGLAPTASTTAALVMGDAIAVSLLEARKFSAQDFAVSHPLGNLGRKLLLKVSDLMHAGDKVPIIQQTANIADTLIEISNKGMGFVSVVDDNNTLVGIFTDGDLRRVLTKKVDIHDTEIKAVMTKGATTIEPNLLAAEALQLMESKKINALVVLDKNQQPVGAINMHDLLNAKIL
ncbi:KpsF/GutQ family sugar-phosphate isomerase [Catenovulum maritimum]|uniref:Arabinose 5-phosphate isomerase n=1 Tax=Catenovulum maritimum TaxID=1513271 RepID=A0A0J8GUR6_9ALTE|nr:KpsF/GutQ family sugar-phosphate isomerase [Catenovulum maritimum]KMT65024.1 D-arabinose 5-phosphate isomerase [Catenovulum maritimum]